MFTSILLDLNVIPKGVQIMSNDPEKIGDVLYKVVENIPEMLPIKEVASRTGLSYNYIRKLCIENKIVHVKAGVKYLVNFGRFCEYLNKGENYDR